MTGTTVTDAWALATQEDRYTNFISYKYNKAGAEAGKPKCKLRRSAMGGSSDSAIDQ